VHAVPPELDELELDELEELPLPELLPEVLPELLPEVLPLEDPLPLPEALDVPPLEDPLLVLLPLPLPLLLEVPPPPLPELLVPPLDLPPELLPLPLLVESGPASPLPPLEDELSSPLVTSPPFAQAATTIQATARHWTSDFMTDLPWTLSPRLVRTGHAIALFFRDP
jgi:hypothetical protein